jgi:hypothetical protein
MTLDRPMAVQVMQATNVGVPKKTSADGEEGEDAESNQDAGQEEEKKFESMYLDKNLIKEKKKANKDG